MRYEDVIDIYKTAFPSTRSEADSGYILRDGALIDISSKGRLPYYHGGEFRSERTLFEWKLSHPELPVSDRQAIDAVMNDIGAIEFTIDNAHMQCVRLPNKPLTAEQRQPLSEIVGRILERGKIRVEILGTREYAEYEANVSTTEQVMSKIEAYYSVGHLQA